MNINFLNIPRRRFLLGLFAYLFLLKNSCKKQDDLEDFSLSLGHISKFKEGITHNSKLRIAVLKTELKNKNKFEAIKLVCTHQECALNYSSSNNDHQNATFNCPCHGARFDYQGQVLRGPAKKPLNKLKLELSSEDELLVYPNILAEEPLVLKNQ